MKTAIFLTAGMILIGLAMPCRASLEWSDTKCHLNVHPLQETTRASFPFVNAGDDPIEILSVDVSCGCLTPTLTNKVYQPGERGQIDVDFLLKGRRGLQHKEIRVRTSDRPKRPVRLFISVEIPEGYNVTPKRLIWERAAEYEPKICRIVNRSDETIEPSDILPTVEAMDLELKTIRAGWEYELQVTPHDGVKNLRGFIRIETIPPEGMECSRDYKVYLFVK